MGNGRVFWWLRFEVWVDGVPVGPQELITVLTPIQGELGTSLFSNKNFIFLTLKSYFFVTRAMFLFEMERII